jgi:hypothetical protein
MPADAFVDSFSSCGSSIIPRKSRKHTPDVRLTPLPQMHILLRSEQLRAISGGKAAHVKACHAMRGALELLDFEDASINDMKRMLLQVGCGTAEQQQSQQRHMCLCRLQCEPKQYYCYLLAGKTFELEKHGICSVASACPEQLNIWQRWSCWCWFSTSVILCCCRRPSALRL